MLDLLVDIFFPEAYYNNSGIYQIHYAAKDWISSVTRSGTSAAVTFYSGKGWKLIESSKLTQGLTIQPEYDDNGPFYSSKLPGHLPHKDLNHTQFFELLSRIPIIVKALDNNGNVRLIGNLSEPAELKIKQFSTIGLPGNKEGYSWEISCLNSEIPPHI